MNIDTKYIKLSADSGDFSLLSEPALVLKNGGLVVFPTETVYGIGADATSSVAVQKIFAAKGRPCDNPLIVHVCSLQQAATLVQDFPANALLLANKFWPGPLTIVLEKNDIIPDVVTCGLSTVGIRFPSDRVAVELIRQSGVPIAAPSANLSGKPSPTTATHCKEDLHGRVDYIIDCGSCNIGVESTVVSLAGSTPRLLRPGAITLEQLREVLGEVAVDDGVLHCIPDGQAVASPGMKYSHYSPKAKVIIVHGPIDKFAEYVNSKPDDSAFALVFEGDIDKITMNKLTYGQQADGEQQARLLFSTLRKLDEMGATIVYARPPATTGMGLAVYNRLIRAAAFEEVFV